MQMVKPHKLSHFLTDFTIGTILLIGAVTSLANNQVHAKSPPPLSKDQCNEIKKKFSCGGESFNVHLSFDDGPSNENTRKVLKTLKAHKIKASFFLVGERAEQPIYTATIQQMERDGHMIGSHS